MSTTDAETIERATRLRLMMNEYLKTMSPQERDRMMQVHLAQARGPLGNGRALKLLTNALIRLRKDWHSTKEGQVGKSPGDQNDRRSIS